MRAGLAHFRVTLQSLGHYRANLAVWNVVSVLQVLVYLSVWSAVARASGGTVDGYDAGAFAAYYVAMLVIRTVTVPSIIWRTMGEVRRGTFAILLLRPHHPFLAIHTGEFAATVLSVANVLVFAVPIALVFGAAFDASAAAMLAAAALVPFAIVTRYLMDSLVATLAFRFVRIEGIRALHLLALLFLGGQFAPLDVFPDALATVARALPYYWTLGFPVELFVGRAPLADAWTGLLVLAAWSTALYLAFRVAWSRGVRALESVGQ